jgi:hypothetical protein
MAKANRKSSKKSGKNTDKAERKEQLCLCGCKAPVGRRFRQGHDARLHSMVLAVAKKKAKHEFSKETQSYLKTAPWMTKEIAAEVL